MTGTATTTTAPAFTLDTLLECVEKLGLPLKNPWQELALRSGYDLDAGDMLVIGERWYAKLRDFLPEISGWPMHKQVQITKYADCVLTFIRRPQLTELVTELVTGFDKLGLACKDAKSAINYFGNCFEGVKVANGMTWVEFNAKYPVKRSGNFWYIENYVMSRKPKVVYQVRDQLWMSCRGYQGVLSIIPSA